MKKMSRIIPLAFYAFAAIIGAGFAVMSVPSPNDDTSKTYVLPPATHAVPQNIQTSEPPPSNTFSSSGAHISASSNIVLSCLGPCLNISKQLNRRATIDDDNFETLSGQMSKLAAYLEGNEDARNDMLERAMTTQDSNKRALIVEAFSLLPEEQREQLGQALFKSDNWRTRTDGVNVFSASQNMTPNKATILIERFPNETHAHVKTTVLSVLKNSESLQGHQDTLDKLSLIISSETDATVKSEALLTKLALQPDPLKAMPDVLSALSSEDPDFQLSALIALEHIYKTDQAKNDELGQIDHITVKRMLNDLHQVKATPDNKKLLDRLFREAEAFYDRHYY